MLKELGPGNIKFVRTTVDNQLLLAVVLPKVLARVNLCDSDVFVIMDANLIPVMTRQGRCCNRASRSSSRPQVKGVRSV